MQYPPTLDQPKLAYYSSSDQPQLPLKTVMVCANSRTISLADLLTTVVSRFSLEIRNTHGNYSIALPFPLPVAHTHSSETCIKGHRSSSCKHTDRPLFEIKKKGRPVTQCDHCRELRKTKQVHVKCSCESKDDSDGPSTSVKGDLYLTPLSLVLWADFEGLSRVWMR